MSAKKKTAARRTRARRPPVKRAGVPGAIYGKDTMFFRVAAGDATDSDGSKYELTTNVGNGLPIIRSERSGRWWTIGWQELIDLAIAAGINEPEEKP